LAEIFAAWQKFLLPGGNFCCSEEIFAAWHKFLILGRNFQSLVEIFDPWQKFSLPSRNFRCPAEIFAALMKFSLLGGNFCCLAEILLPKSDGGKHPAMQPMPRNHNLTLLDLHQDEQTADLSTPSFQHRGFAIPSSSFFGTLLMRKREATGASSGPQASSPLSPWLWSVSVAPPRMQTCHPLVAKRVGSSTWHGAWPEIFAAWHEFFAAWLYFLLLGAWQKFLLQAGKMAAWRCQSPHQQWMKMATSSSPQPVWLSLCPAQLGV
jgi:hypothetical protein